MLLNECAPAEDIESIVAHEIAHAWFKHERPGPLPPDCEIQAANQTRDWGFRGLGADPKGCFIPPLIDITHHHRWYGADDASISPWVYADLSNQLSLL